MKECENSEGKIAHEFKFQGTFTESTTENHLFHQVGYSVCVKCGEIRKQNL